MTVPAEYERSSAKFYEFLIEARDISGLWSTHVTYTMVQGVFRVFRRRLSVDQSIQFANELPICLRALFVTDWDLSEPIRKFESLEAMTAEVKELRSRHNFSTDSAIQSVAAALRKQVNAESFDRLLEGLPAGAKEFWAP